MDKIIERNKAAAQPSNIGPYDSWFGRVYQTSLDAHVWNRRSFRLCALRKVNREKARKTWQLKDVSDVRFDKTMLCLSFLSARFKGAGLDNSHIELQINDLIEAENNALT